MSAIGGTVSLVGWGLAAAFAIQESNKGGVVIGAIIGAAGLFLVLYDCGTRVLRLEDALGPKNNRDRLILALLMLENVRAEVSELTSDEYIDTLYEDGTSEIVVPKLQEVETLLNKSCRKTDVLLVLNSSTGMVVTQVDPNTPDGELGQIRQTALDELDHYAANLKVLIART